MNDDINNNSNNNNLIDNNNITSNDHIVKDSVKESGWQLLSNFYGQCLNCGD